MSSSAYGAIMCKTERNSVLSSKFRFFVDCLLHTVCIFWLFTLGALVFFSATLLPLYLLSRFVFGGAL